jgi:predicted dehydrogenase
VRVIVAGLGVQGAKRCRIAGTECVGTVDPSVEDADYEDITEVPLDSYDAALLCVPDAPKVGLAGWLADRGKHVLVEKPLCAPEDAELEDLQERARRTSAVVYTAYNHRFEPHFIRLRDLIASGRLGRPYRCRLFYGNGTARQVRDSTWRDQGSGVLHDLGSHLLDAARFWFGDLGEDFRVISADRFENRAPDHVVVGSEGTTPRLELEMTFLMWHNHFTCDLLAEAGSAHIESLCKWGPSTFTHRARVLPSGRPPEEAVTLVRMDPTWALEYDHFKLLVKGRAGTDLGRDLWLNRVLGRLHRQIVAEEPA